MSRHALGGIRRDRKRLKRCAHRDIITYSDPATADEIVQCRLCLSYTRISPRSFISATFAHPRPGKLPDRIARKAADA